MKLLLSFTGLLFTTFLFGQSAKQTYQIPDLKSRLVKHRIVAILPFRMSAVGNRLQEQKDGINMQQGMYTYLLRKSKNYSVSFQDVERTNIILKEAGIFDEIDETMQDSICKILKVDAIIRCTYAYEKTGFEAGGIVKTLFFGSGGITAFGSLTMQINDGVDGTLLWRFSQEMSKGAFTSDNDMMERIMRKVSRNFPYEN